MQIEDLVELQLSDFDHLINKKKLEEDDDFITVVNEHTRYDRMAWGRCCVGQGRCRCSHGPSDPSNVFAGVSS